MIDYLYSIGYCFIISIFLTTYLASVIVDEGN